jgi:glycosyltransferase involved in cell wall biosynthesis
VAFVFWQNVASHYERDLLCAIATASGSEVICAVEQDLPADRIELGWSMEDFRPVKLVRSDERATFETLVARRDDIHVLTGFLHHPVITEAFHELSRVGARIVLHSESVDVHGVKGAVRVARDRVKAFSQRKHVAGVLAIGDFATRYFAKLGFDRRRIIPFGYFVQAKGGGDARANPQPGPSGFRLVYAGQFIRRKGLDDLFAALGSLRDVGWTLIMIGSGPHGDPLKRLAESLEIADRIEWHGPKEPERVPRWIAGADLFVLPSHWDGWGVVINESLAVGVPVVCSDRCGAECVLKDERIGETFPVSNVSVLAAVLRHRIEAGRIPETTRVACRTAAAALTPEAGAKQFLDGIVAITSGATPPSAPWLRQT